MIDERLALLQLGIAKSHAIEAAQRGRLDAIHRRGVSVARTKAWKAAVAGEVTTKRNVKRVP